MFLSSYIFLYRRAEKNFDGIERNYEGNWFEWLLGYTNHSTKLSLSPESSSFSLALQQTEEISDLNWSSDIPEELPILGSLTLEELNFNLCDSASWACGV